MSNVETFTGLSGDGETDFAAAWLCYKVQVHVTTLANRSRAMVTDVPALIKGLGWWSFYEHKGKLATAPTGFVVTEPRFIQFANQTWINFNNTAFDPSGFDGFRWHLYAGCVADLMFIYP